MLSKLFQFVKKNLDTLILIVGVMLFVLLSFAAGYIMAKAQSKQPVIIENAAF